MKEEFAAFIHETGRARRRGVEVRFGAIAGRAAGPHEAAPGSSR